MNARHTSIRAISAAAIAAHGRWFFLSMLALVFTSCSSFDAASLNPLSWFDDDEVNPPAELLTIDREVDLRREWSVKIGNGQGGNYNEITPVIDGDTIFAASENGTIMAIEVSSGDVRWRQYEGGR